MSIDNKTVCNRFFKKDPNDNTYYVCTVGECQQRLKVSGNGYTNRMSHVRMVSVFSCYDL